MLFLRRSCSSISNITTVVGIVALICALFAGVVDGQEDRIVRAGLPGEFIGGVTAGPTNRSVYVSSSLTGAIQLIDIDSGRKTRVINRPNRLPFPLRQGARGLWYDADRGLILSVARNRVHVYMTPNYERLVTCAGRTSLYENFNDITVNGNYAYATDEGTSNVFKLFLPDAVIGFCTEANIAIPNTLIPIPFTSGLRGITPYASDGLLIANTGGGLLLLNVTLEETSVLVSPSVTGAGLEGVALSKDDNLVYIIAISRVDIYPISGGDDGQPVVVDTGDRSIIKSEFSFRSATHGVIRDDELVVSNSAFALIPTLGVVDRLKFDV